MGRSNLTILLFGIFACVALSLMMSHAAGIKEKRDVHPAVLDIQALYGADMARRPKLAIETRARETFAVMTIWPRHMVVSQRLARMVGRHMVSRRSPDLQFDALEIVAVDGRDAQAPARIFPIDVPRGYGRFDQRPRSVPADRNRNRAPAGGRPAGTPKAPERPSGPPKRP